VIFSGLTVTRVLLIIDYQLGRTGYNACRYAYVKKEQHDSEKRVAHWGFITRLHTPCSGAGTLQDLHQGKAHTPSATAYDPLPS
jgi:hypothetical protein